MLRRALIVTVVLLVVLFVVGLVIGPQSPPVAAPQPTRLPTVPPASVPTALPATVGTATRNGTWEVRLSNVSARMQIGTTRADGIFAIVTVDATNLTSQSSQLNGSDFSVMAANGVRSFTSGSGTAALSSTPGPEIIDVIGPKIAAGQSKTLRLVFDLPPGDRGFLLRAADIPFRFTLPAI